MKKNLQKIRDILIFFTYKAPLLTATRLQKLFYLAELRFIEKTGKRLTGAKFLNYYYGPFSHDVALVADEFEHKDIKVDKVKVKGHDARMYKPSAKETEVNLGKEEIGILKEVLGEWGFRKTKVIVKHVKEGEPFVWSEYGEEIDFDTYRRCCDKLYRDAKVRKQIKENIKTKGKVFSGTKELTEALASK